MVKKPLLFALITIFFVNTFNLISQNPKMDGYKGNWYKSGQSQEYGYKFSGGVATFASRHRPIAVYSPEVKKTFFVYGGTKSPDESHLLIMVSYFDHRHHVVPKPVIVYDKQGVREPNDNASLSVDSDGYLWIFISGRGRTRPGMIFRGLKPYSIESFEKIVECEMVSPQPWWIDDSGFMLMFSKNTKGRELYFSTSVDGKIWTEGQKIAGIGGHFQVSGALRNKLVTVFNYHPGGNVDRRTNLYLLQTEDMGKTWKTIDNKVVKIPVADINNEALVKNYETEGKLVYINDLNFDKEGNPVLLVLLSGDFFPGPNSGPREWMIIHWKNQIWNFVKVCESDHNYDMGSLYIEDNEWRIIGTTGPGPQENDTGGEIALWISKNEGNSWEKVFNVTNNSKYNNSFLRHPENAQKEFYAFWTDGNTDKISESHLYFTNYKCNKVWVLPYEMKNESARPVRVKQN